MTVIKNNQPWLLRIVAAMLAVTVLVLLGIAAYVYWLTFDPKQIAEGADNIHGLYIGAAVVGGAGVVFLIATLLLWKRWRAGWWLSLAANVIAAVALLWDPIFEHDPLISEDTAIALWFATMIALLFFPPVRKVFRNKGAKVSVVTAT